MSETRLHTFGSRFLTVGLLLWLTASLFAQTTAQERASQMVQRSSLTITASAAGDRVRIAAPASVVQMRIEVYGAGSEKLFDQEIRGGNVFDWHLQDGQAQRLAAGTYICVVTAKNISGKLTQKMGTVIVEEKSVSVQPADSQQLSVQQAQTIGPVEENPSWTIPEKDEQQTTTVIAHDGTDGQLTRGRGALSFRIGDFFSGTDKEQMRITEDGRVGIGTDKPEATLDVAGTVRVSEGLRFADGTTLAAAAGKFTVHNAKGDPVLDSFAAGTGTQNQVAKWTETGGAGTLGDSAITEVGERVGIGITNPTYKLVVGPDIGPGLTTSDLTVSRGAGQSVSAFVGASGSNGMNFGWDQANQRAFVNAPVLSPITFTHGGVSERMRIATNGNVGVGTASPRSKLDVRGNIQLGNGGQYFATGGEENLRIVRGVVGYTGNIIVGSGFHVSSPEQGKFIVTFDSSFAAPPAVTVTPDRTIAGTTDRIAMTDGVTASTANIRLVFRDSGDNAWGTFHFIAIGPR